MDQKYLSLAAIVLVASISLSGCSRTENASSGAASSSDAKLKFQALNVGNQPAAGGAVAPLTLFTPEDRIIASIQTNNAAIDVPVSARLVAMSNGQPLSVLSRKVTTTGATTTSFEFPKTGTWALGRYQVEALIDGKVQARQDIEVRQDGPPKAAAQK